MYSHTVLIHTVMATGHSDVMILGTCQQRSVKYIERGIPTVAIFKAYVGIYGYIDMSCSVVIHTQVHDTGDDMHAH